MTGRCCAAYPHDKSPCDGPIDALVVFDDQADVAVTACVHHGALLLAFVRSARSHAGTVPRAAVEAEELARTIAYQRLATATHQRLPLREFIRCFIGDAIRFEGDPT